MGLDLEPLTKMQICSLLGINDGRTLDQIIRDGSFPAGFPAGRGLGLRWYRGDVEAYLWLQMRTRKEVAPRKAKKQAEVEENEEGQEEEACENF